MLSTWDIHNNRLRWFKASLLEKGRGTSIEHKDVSITCTVASVGVRRGRLQPDMAAKQTGSGFTPLGKEETAKIKVLFYNDQAFNMLYGSAFSVKHPNIEVEVVSMMPLMMSGNPSKEAFDQLIKEQKPDVLFLNAEQYQRLSGDGRLLQLDPIVKQTGFDIENLHPTVVELLKSKGNGSLYGLAPSFGGRALFYNKDLFDRYGVAYPTDQMTWDEVLQLAKRFPTDQQGDQRIYGYAPAVTGWDRQAATSSLSTISA